ncbi:DUF7662 domain-containing protein [Phenylobacterium sp.]|jgi:hypothetical protein|uniref:DUF7662 domain-containing protein n=1 Tax=Phenylobacterium sp. TaxID=1871053 RepID=UPI002F42F592
MTKYQPLRDHLQGHKAAFWRASFDDLEQVLGFTLPKTARESTAWWANDAEKAHCRTWLDAGWRIESVDRAGQVALFERQDVLEDDLPERYFTPVPNPAVSDGSESKLRRAMGLTAVVGGVVAVAAGLGAVAFKVMRKKG